jgi:putative membrane protein
MDGEGTGGGGRFEVAPNAPTHFAWLRTRLAVERTLMSWVRTATALIGFGFTIYQFLTRLNTTPGVAPAALPEAPRYFGLALIGAGVIALAVAQWEYRWVIRYLWSPEFRPVAGLEEERRRTPILGIALLLMLIGIAAFVAVLLRVS